MLNVLYEDSDMAVIEKPAGISTHPGAAGFSEHTLVDELKKQFPHLSMLGGDERPGIVHRLDKETSGLLLVAKTDKAYTFLVKEMKSHKIEKHYKSLLVGHLEPRNGTIEAPIGRSFHNRKKMAVTPSDKNAVTHYRVLEYIPGFTYVDVQIETGRTHQIRVHFQAIGFPVAGDDVYGKKNINLDLDLHRQFLHAYKLSFVNLEGKKITVESKLPEDLEKVLDRLKS